MQVATARLAYFSTCSCFQQNLSLASDVWPSLFLLWAKKPARSPTPTACGGANEVTRAQGPCQLWINSGSVHTDGLLSRPISHDDPPGPRWLASAYHVHGRGPRSLDLARQTRQKGHSGFTALDLARKSRVHEEPWFHVDGTEGAGHALVCWSPFWLVGWPGGTAASGWPWGRWPFKPPSYTRLRRRQRQRQHAHMLDGGWPGREPYVCRIIIVPL